jgi:hypothetical protein
VATGDVIVVRYADDLVVGFWSRKGMVHSGCCIDRLSRHDFSGVIPEDCSRSGKDNKVGARSQWLWTAGNEPRGLVRDNLSYRGIWAGWLTVETTTNAQVGILDATAVRTGAARAELCFEASGPGGGGRIQIFPGIRIPV